jgi:hypothetical protein
MLTRLGLYSLKVFVRDKAVSRQYRLLVTFEQLQNAITASTATQAFHIGNSMATFMGTASGRASAPILSC